MMKGDNLYAIGLSVLFFIFVATNYKFPQALEALSYFGRPAATILVLGSVVVLYYKDLHKTALVATLLSVYLLTTIWTTWPRSDEKRLHLEIGRDQSRFEEQNSIDLQFATGSAKFDAPDMLLSPTPFPELLVFPPSSETMTNMCGN